MVSLAKRAISSKRFQQFWRRGGLHSKQPLKANVRHSNMAISGVHATLTRSHIVKELDPCTINKTHHSYILLHEKREATPNNNKKLKTKTNGESRWYLLNNPCLVDEVC